MSIKNKKHALVLLCAATCLPLISASAGPSVNPKPAAFSSEVSVKPASHDSIQLFQRFMLTPVGTELNSLSGFVSLGDLDPRSELSQRVAGVMARYLPGNFDQDLQSALETQDAAGSAAAKERVRSAYIQAGSYIAQKSVDAARAYDSGKMDTYEFSRTFQQLRPFLLYSPIAAKTMSNKIREATLRDASAMASQLTNQGDLSAQVDDLLRPVTREEFQEIARHMPDLRRVKAFTGFCDRLDRLKDTSMEFSYLAPVARALPEAETAVHPSKNPLPHAIMKARSRIQAAMEGLQKTALSFTTSLESLSAQGMTELESVLSRMQHMKHALPLYFDDKETHYFHQSIAAAKAVVHYQRDHP